MNACRMPSIASANAFAKLRLLMAGLRSQISQQASRQTVHARRFSSFVVIVAAEMERAVYDQTLHLFLDRRAVCTGLAARGLHRYDDVAERFTGSQAVADVER